MKDVILYMSKRAEMTFSKLALNRVKISLYDVVKTTGELKDVFRFTYNGRRYDRLSLSEKIRAGAEVSELVKRLTGRNYPVFFDNMESVDDLSNIRPTSQMILAKCVRNAELSVRAGSTACRRRRNLTFQKGGAPSGLSEAADPGSRQTVRACPQRPNASQRGS